MCVNRLDFLYVELHSLHFSANIRRSRLKKGGDWWCWSNDSCCRPFSCTSPKEKSICLRMIRRLLSLTRELLSITTSRRLMIHQSVLALKRFGEENFPWHWHWWRVISDKKRTVVGQTKIIMINGRTISSCSIFCHGSTLSVSSTGCR